MGANGCLWNMCCFYAKCQPKHILSQKYTSSLSVSKGRPKMKLLMLNLSNPRMVITSNIGWFRTTTTTIVNAVKWLIPRVIGPYYYSSDSWVVTQTFDEKSQLFTVKCLPTKSLGNVTSKTP